MRLSRRAALRLGLGAGIAGAGLGSGAFLVRRSVGHRHGSGEVRAATIRARPLGPLLPDESSRTRFGALRFRTGLVLTSDDPGFGGWSGLWRSADGRQLVAVSDNAQWLVATCRSGPGGIEELVDATVAPVLGEAGEPLRDGDSYDTESLAIADGVAFVGIERVHHVRRFADWGRSGVRARGVPMPMPAEAATLPENRGLEAVGVAPPGHPLAGQLVAISEGAGDADSPSLGWVLTGERRFAFRVVREDGFNVTDLQFLASGDLLLLERHFSPWRGVSCRMRRLPPDAIVPDGLLDGPVIFRADRAYAIDNMEGLAVHRDEAGRTVLTMISDDNFSPFQRTLLLEFELSDP